MRAGHCRARAVNRSSTKWMRGLVIAGLIVAPGAVSAARAADHPSSGLTVFAASSLTDVLQQIGAEYRKTTGVAVRFSFAASSALARQIESGGRSEVFFSADPEWMNYLDARGLIDRRARRDLLGNRLVLIAPSDSRFTIRLERNAPLIVALGSRGRLATGDPDSTPVGKYARAALTALNLWKDLEPRLVRADNVRAALMYVARGEAPLGIVYATDARMEPRVRIVAVFPESSHPPITYSVAAVAGASERALAFVEFLTGDTARAIFINAGFTVFQSTSAPEQPPR